MLHVGTAWCRGAESESESPESESCQKEDCRLLLDFYVYIAVPYNFCATGLDIY